MLLSLFASPIAAAQLSGDLCVRRQDGVGRKQNLARAQPNRVLALGPSDEQLPAKQGKSNEGDQRANDGRNVAPLLEGHVKASPKNAAQAFRVLSGLLA
jgi:hypothetical protein